MDTGFPNKCVSVWVSKREGIGTLPVVSSDEDGEDCPLPWPFPCYSITGMPVPRALSLTSVLGT